MIPPRIVTSLPSVILAQFLTEVPYHGPSLLNRFLALGWIEMAALGAMLLSVVLILGLPYLAANRRQLAIFIGVAICLGVGGYVVYDFDYVVVNFYLYDAKNLRVDCGELFRQRHISALAGTRESTQLVAPNLPPSLLRCGARCAFVEDGSVQIWFPERTFGTEWGILYDPKHEISSTDFRRFIRPTWRRDFYQFVIPEG